MMIFQANQEKNVQYFTQATANAAVNFALLTHIAQINMASIDLFREIQDF